MVLRGIKDFILCSYRKIIIFRVVMVSSVYHTALPHVMARHVLCLKFCHHFESQTSFLP